MNEKKIKFPESTTCLSVSYKSVRVVIYMNDRNQRAINFYAIPLLSYRGISIVACFDKIVINNRCLQLTFYCFCEITNN